MKSAFLIYQDLSFYNMKPVLVSVYDQTAYFNRVIEIKIATVEGERVFQLLRCDAKVKRNAV